MKKIKKKNKLLLKSFEWVLFAMLLIIFAAILSPLLPTKKFFTSYAVVSGSMEPTIETGSISFLKPQQPSKYEKGDIIAFSLPEKPKTIILHRITSSNVQNGIISYQTKGDANSTKDSWTVSHEQVKGKYVFALPYIGYSINMAQSPIGFTLAIGIPALFLILLQIRSIKQGISEEVEKRLAEKNWTPFNIPKLSVILLSISILCISTPPVHAVFNSVASLTGLTVSTKETFAIVSLTHFQTLHKAEIKVEKIDTYKKIAYKLKYTSGATEKQVEGEKALTNEDEFTKDIILGSCSDEDCTYDANPHYFVLQITLFRQDNTTVNLEKTL